MAVGYIDPSFLAGTGGTSATITATGGVGTLFGATTGNLMLVAAYNRGSANTVSVADSADTSIAWVKVHEHDNGTTSLTLWAKLIQAGHLSSTFTINVTGATTNCTASVVILTCGGSETFDVNDLVEGLSGESNASGNESHASITTTTTDFIYFVMAGQDDRVAFEDANPAIVNDGGLGTTVPGVVANATGAVDSTMGIGIMFLAAPGATGTCSWGNDNIASSSILTGIKAVAAGGGAETLTADPGSYTITGTAMTPRVTLPAVSGSYSLTGTDAALLHSYKITAEAGSVALTGTAAGLDVTLLAEAGSYTITGTAAALFKSFQLTAEAGSVVVTGQNSGLDTTLPVGVGSFTISGTAAALTPELNAGEGSVVITGTDATLTAPEQGAETLTADPGSFTITGEAAGLDVTLPPATGSVALTGTDATFDHSRAAAPGAVSISGTAAHIIVVLPANSGAVTITGIVAGLDVTMPAGSGEFLLTGTAADLLHITDATLTAEAGEFTITGTNAHACFALFPSSVGGGGFPFIIND